MIPPNVKGDVVWLALAGRSEVGAAGGFDALPVDPPGVLGQQRTDDTADVVGPPDTTKRRLRRQKVRLRVLGDDQIDAPFGQVQRGTAAKASAGAGDQRDLGLR